MLLEKGTSQGETGCQRSCPSGSDAAPLATWAAWQPGFLWLAINRKGSPNSGENHLRREVVICRGNKNPASAADMFASYRNCCMDKFLSYIESTA